MRFDPTASFVYQSHPGRVLFGHGTVRRLPEELDKLGLKRLLVLSTPAQRSSVEAIIGSLEERVVGLFAQAAMHTPIEITDEAMSLVRTLKVDGVLAVGGGSTTGLGKAIAWRTNLPQVVLPTTYAGSEMTPILGETANGAKTTRSDARILPELVLYDVDLTLDLPVGLSVTSGMNAIAHAVEALYAKDRNPIISMIAVDGIASLQKALPQLVADPGDPTARASALYGAWLCGTCLGAVGMALHHKLCHVLGGSFDLPHAQTHTVVLPHALAYNAPAVPEAMASLRRLFGDDPPRALYDLVLAIGAPTALRDLGMREGDIEVAAAKALSNPYWNPRPLDHEPIRRLIANAWAGTPPPSSKGY